MASTHTKALTLNVQKCQGAGCATPSEINKNVDGLIINVLAIQDMIDYQKLYDVPTTKVVKVLSLMNLRSDKFMTEVNTMTANTVETFDNKFTGSIKTFSASFFEH